MERNDLGQFVKGGIPYNKGIKRGSFGRMAETQFKSGGAPHNTLPVGTERRMTDGYLKRKVQLSGKRSEQWRPVHQLVWEEENGPIPKGHRVIFLDGNKDHLEIENLKLVSKDEVVQLNHNKFRFSDGKLTKAGLGILKIEEKVKTYEED
ncbi:HNH endonuclease signature motif containing protein [Liquorilactobacillus nagelii]|uniref:HNH endonuclease signature motif containing protein n=1 Tax=Liquorilactobacillus nagelii TaxID=82688 RepID=UPI0039EBE114